MTVLKVEIRERLVDLIINGEFKQSNRLPTMRALASSFSTSVATIQKVINELKKDGYVTAIHGKKIEINRNSPMIRKKSAHRIGVLSFYNDIHTKKSGYPLTVLRPMEKVLSESGYSVEYFGINQYNEIELMEKLANAELSGIVLLEINDGHLIGEIKKLRLPTISLDYNAYSAGVSSLVFSNTWGAFMATRHLIDSGHKLITAINPSYRRQFGNNPFEDSVQQDRILGYSISMKYAGLEPKVVDIGINLVEIQNMLLCLFGSRPCPTALFVHQNLQAKLISSKLLELGFKIPQDVSIIGFDTEGITSVPGIKLSSITVFADQMGIKGAEVLLSEIKGKSSEPKKIVIETGILEGNSVMRIG